MAQLFTWSVTTAAQCPPTTGWTETVGSTSYALTSVTCDYTGPTGSSGYSGRSGYSGTSGYSGKSGYSGLSGYSGPTGTSGFSGPSGYSGKSGYSGLGSSGYSGTSGYSGPTGTSGFSGWSGYSAVGVTTATANTVVARDGSAGIAAAIVTGTTAVLSSTNTATSATQKALSVTPTYNQTSGNAKNFDVSVNRVETALRTGGNANQRLFSGQVNSVDKFYVSNVGNGYFAGDVVFVGNCEAGTFTVDTECDCDSLVCNTLDIEGSGGTPPSNTTLVQFWVDIKVNGTVYKVPCYL